MSSLLEKILRARESKVEVDGHQFTIRRLTDFEAMSLSERSSTTLDVVCGYTVGWNLNEIDLIPGGTPTAAPFDTATFREWVSDQPQILMALATAILDAYRVHADKREEAKKK